MTEPTDKAEQEPDAIPPTGGSTPQPGTLEAPTIKATDAIKPEVTPEQEVVIEPAASQEEKVEREVVKPPALPGSLTDLSPEFLEKLKARLTTARDKHADHGSGDAWRFNGGTIIALVCTSGATLVAAFAGAPAWLAPTVTAIATVIIAIERALGWGARWIYHSDLENAYECLIDMIDFYPFVPASDRGKYAQDIIAALYAVRSRESAIPNAGSNTQR